MATRAQHTNRALDPFLYALHSGTSVREVQTTCARFANELIPADAYGWYQFKRHTVEPEVISARGVSDRFLSLYEREGRSRDPIFSKVAARLATVSSDHHLTACERRSFKFQGEISSGRIGRAIQAPLAVAGELLGSINIARGPSAPVFRQDDAACLDLIARHASLALARAQREQELDRRCTLFEASLDVLNVPFVVAAADGNIMFANRAASLAAAEAAGGLAAGLRENAEMLASGPCRVATAIVRCGCDPGHGRLVVRSIRLDETCAMMSFIYAAPDDTTAALPTLTPREREIAHFVVRGFSNSDIALAASISRNTVKQHLKRVFEKLQVGSRAELAATLARNEPESAAHWRPETLPATPSPDGRAAGRAFGAVDLSQCRKRL